MTSTDTTKFLPVVDADTHLTEPHDLWTSRTPAKWADRVPRVEWIDGDAAWVVDGIQLGRAGSGGVIGVDGSKALGAEFRSWHIEDVHAGAYDVKPRLEMMDKMGIWGQILYPNIIGFGGSGFGRIADLELREACVSMYNDAMADIQDESGQRIFPMAVLPWWDVDKAVAEIRRAAGRGLRGVNTTSDPQDHGHPDLADPYWNPLWEVCVELDLSINFHIGASETSTSWFGTAPWPSLDNNRKMAIGTTMIFYANARVLANLIFSGILDRYPTLKFVSVESGVGWIPFLLDALEYQLGESYGAGSTPLELTPWEYFRRNFYGCFWFEDHTLRSSLDRVGVDNLLFETDFPHPTCLYPDGVEFARNVLRQYGDETVNKLMSLNAAKVYNLPLPVA